jgi:hypothetical protein
MRKLLAIFLLTPLLASAAHFDIIDHPQFPNGGSYLDAGVPLGEFQAQTHWGVTRGAEQPITHTHIQCKDLPLYAHVTQPFDIQCRVTLFQYNAEATIVNSITAQWQSTGTAAGWAAPTKKVSVTPDPNGAVNSEWVTITLDPATSKRSGFMWFRIGASARFNIEPNFVVAAAIKIPVWITNGASDSGAVASDWHPKSSGIGNHFNDNAQPKQQQHAFQYSFNELESHWPILPINAPWIVTVKTGRAERAFENCSVEDHSSSVRLDPALHAGNPGQYISTFSGVSPDPRWSFHTVALDPAELSEGVHKMMAEATTISRPSTCTPPPPPFQDEPNMEQAGIMLASFVVGEFTPPPPTQCDDGVDNDGDGLIDLNDPGCDDAADDDETDPPPVQYHERICVRAPGSATTNPNGTWNSGLQPDGTCWGDEVQYDKTRENQF